MQSSARVQRALAAASELSPDERRELIDELVLGLERDADAEAGHHEAWVGEVRRRVDAVLSGRSKGEPWSEVRRGIEARLGERRRPA